MNNKPRESVIDQLRSLFPDERPAFLDRIYQKNRRYFKKNVPAIDSFIEASTCEYRIDITERFLNVVHVPSETLAHPEAGLDTFAMMMGDWVHNAWIDLFNIRVVSPGLYEIHNTLVKKMFAFLDRNFAGYKLMYSLGNINLKVLDDGRRFSPPVIFLGILSGLHIDYFLSRTEVSSVLLIEPDPTRFEVSCYFLDYEEIKTTMPGSAFIALGDNPRAGSIQNFFRKSAITPLLWARVLPGYSFPEAPVMVEELKLLQTVRSDIIFPLDFELQGLINGYMQIRKKRLLLSDDIATSNQCLIAIVATGPSLNNDLEWLKKNQDRLIIFAVHSSVKILKGHGIVPDFQFSLDINPESTDILTRLDLYRDKPMIQYYKANDDYFNALDTVLMVSEANKPDPVLFKKPLEYTHPSTTCLAFAFADFCAPQEIYLLGCDFGYRSVKNDHAKGSIYDDDTQKSEQPTPKSEYGAAQQALMSSNFNHDEFIQTTAFLSHARIAIEMRIETSSKNYKVFNLSDGVEIRHTITKHSEDVTLQKYPRKQKDIKKILRAFRSAASNDNWRPHAETGSEKFGLMKKAILNRLNLKDFSWTEAARALDSVLDEMIKECRRQKDLRMEIYEAVISNILSAIYSCMIFCDSQTDAENVYRSCLEELEKIFNENLYWPEELDEKL